MSHCSVYGAVMPPYTISDLTVAEAELAHALRWLERAVAEWFAAYGAYVIEHGDDPPPPPWKSNPDPRLDRLKAANVERTRAERTRYAAHLRIAEISNHLSS